MRNCLLKVFEKLFIVSSRVAYKCVNFLSGHLIFCKSFLDNLVHYLMICSSFELDVRDICLSGIKGSESNSKNTAYILVSSFVCSDSYSLCWEKIFKFKFISENISGTYLYICLAFESFDPAIKRLLRKGCMISILWIGVFDRQSILQMSRLRS